MFKDVYVRVDHGDRSRRLDQHSASTQVRRLMRCPLGVETVFWKRHRELFCQPVREERHT